MTLNRKADGPVAVFPAAFGSAALLALAMPGRVGWWPLLFIGLVPLLLTVRNVRPSRSAVGGFLFGLIYHLALLYWILIVLGRYGGLPLWITLPALLLLASYMACYSALFCGLLSLLAGRAQPRAPSMATLVWMAPVLWVGCDALRSVLLTGFPWMDLGYGLFGQPRLIQAADLGGHHLMTFCLVLANGLVAAGVERLRRGFSRNRRVSKGLLLAAVVFLLGVGDYSLFRYQMVEPEIDQANQARVAVVQGNIDQAVKWSPEVKAATVETYLRLSRRAMQEMAADLVVWPETALPFFPQQDALINRVVDFTTAANTWLLTGAPLNTIAQSNGDPDRARYWNGAILLGPGGQVGGQHAKQHLVPFGEYVPLRRFLPFLQPLVVHIDDFSAGLAKGPLDQGAMRLGLLICYESIFPDIARESVERGANLLVNITNDAWYGRSSAPYQSMAMAVFRAVENRRTLIRSANTGISGFVDPLGRIANQTDIFVEAAQVAQVPMLEQATYFGRGGHWFGLACATCSTLLLLLRLFRRRN